MRIKTVALLCGTLAIGAFAGITCAQSKIDGPVDPVDSAPRAQGWTTEKVVGGLRNPWAVAFLPSGEMLITERPGRLRVVSAEGELRDNPVSGLPEVFASGQGGLMDVSLHPRFEETRWVYLTHSAGSANENYTVLVRGTLSDDLSSLDEVERIFEVAQKKPGGQHFGSRILWLEDGTMLMSIGDGGNPPVEVDGKLARFHAQDLKSHLGKTLRLDENGKPAPANPFMGDPENAGAVYTYGHRNIQGIAMHPDTGEVWATEHGARGGDELNKIEAGTNYGWPLVTYSREYWGPRISQDTSMPEAQDPAVVWTPCIAPSGLAFYTGDKMPEWRGDLFAGGLVLKQVRRLMFDDNGQPAGQQTLQFPSRIRDVRNGPDGFLYVLTDERDGQLLRIVAE